MNTDNRTDDELNRIIAEWMGFTLWESKRGEYTLQYAWKPGSDPISGVHWSAREEYKKTNWQVEWSKYDSGRFGGQLPEYCRDLNAVHEAERALSNGTLSSVYDRFELHLAEVCFLEGHRRNMIHSTARQRAEALVRVIEDSKK